MKRRAATLSLAAGLLAPAWAQEATRPSLPSVRLAGVMGARALLVIDGQTQVLAVGQSAQGVTLRALQGDSAQVDTPAGPLVLRVGAAPVAVGAGAPRGPQAREIVLTAGPGGHFTTQGTINGQTVTFLVDTGATLISMSQAEAARLRLDLRQGERGISNTANGPVPVVIVTLNAVRVGEIEVANVQAVVMPAQMPYVLLGNSFLSRFQMRRENDVMRLEFRR